MRIETTPGPTAPRVLQQPASLPEEIEADSSFEFRTRALAPDEHDPALLIAALEQLAAQREAIEWLANANLLCRCLV